MILLGWLDTYEQYFLAGAHHIINTVVKMLTNNKNYRFIWSEMSFLSLWWERASAYQRQLLKSLIYNGQLEIVTGGWVSK